jgi:hypothetical protein
LNLISIQRHFKTISFKFQRTKWHQDPAKFFANQLEINSHTLSKKPNRNRILRNYWS